MSSDLPQYRDHPRTLHGTRWVYPVVSRRSRGVSVGINLSPDGRCNFDCAYCQVDRRTPRPKVEVDEAELLAELDQVLDAVESGALFEDPRFAGTPAHLRRLNDLALSGDGEPTSYPRFAELLTELVARSRARGLPGRGVKLVLITNGTLLHRADVKRGLALIAEHGGELWTKLDAGTEAYYRRVNRSQVPFARVLEDLASTARTHPIVVQTCFCRLDGEPPSDAEVEAYAARLEEIGRSGGRIERVDLYTTARTPAEPWVSALEVGEIEGVAERVRRRTGLRVEAFG